MSVALVTLCLALAADEPIAPEKAAAIEQGEQKARAEVSAKYGNRKPTELSREERKSLDKDLADASKQVMEKNGVDPKQYAREQLKKGRDDYAKTKELVKELNEKDKQAAEAAKKGEPKEIEIQRGVTEDNPVILDEKATEEGTVQVEKGLPPDAQRDLNEANGDEGGGGGAASAPAMEEAPAPKQGKGGKGGKRR